MSFVVVAAVGAGVAATAGLTKAITGGVQARKARIQKEKEMAELEEYKRQFAGLDTSNPFQNMENVFEDLTVNQQEAEFTRQQQQQSQANILQQTRGAAGASGIAALAQTLARQSSLDAQQAAVSIGKQEQQNQLLKQQEEARLEGQFRQGEIMRREAEASKVKTLMGMEAAEAEKAARDQAAAQQVMFEGISDIGQAGISAMTTGMAAKAGMTGGELTGGVDYKKAYEDLLAKNEPNK